jgi:penicillin-binding protein-related factor A (putative recombinase)
MMSEFLVEQLVTMLLLYIRQVMDQQNQQLHQTQQVQVFLFNLLVRQVLTLTYLLTTPSATFRKPNMDKIQLTDEQIDHIAERAAEVAFKRIYEEVGRSVVKKIFWIVGAGALGLMIWLAGNGQLPK